jgi:c-di-GMP-binding flagellar brake protein YcgR
MTMQNPSPDSAETGPADYHQYAVASRLEINQILQALTRHAALITATIAGEDFFLTSIIKIDDNAGYLILEGERTGRDVGRIMNRQRLLCNTTLDKIKIQFVCEGLEIVDCDGRDAFKTPLPQDLRRLQRREAYRISTPITTPVKCTILVPRGDTHAAVELRLIDISCGGISVLLPPELFTPELGTHYDCTIHLPGTAALRTRVQARNAFMINLTGGKVAQRSGFAFVDLRESMLATVQRYIMALERQRKK